MIPFELVDCVWEVFPPSVQEKRQVSATAAKRKIRIFFI